MVLSLFAGISFGQVSKTDATAATLNASIATRNFTFTSGEFGGCASLTEVEVDLTLTFGEPRTLSKQDIAAGY